MYQHKFEIIKKNPTSFEMGLYFKKTFLLFAKLWNHAVNQFQHFIDTIFW